MNTECRMSNDEWPRGMVRGVEPTSWGFACIGGSVSGTRLSLLTRPMGCNGQIDQVGSGIVQSLFGTCDAPRDVCP